MTINLQIPDVQELKPRITVFGVGGAGGNAVNNMINSGLQGVEFVVANTDAQALTLSKAQRIIQLGVDVTEGLGAGSHPEVGEAAAEESFDEINDHLSGSHMVFITAGMGGGTGTGAAPVVARAAREQGILTVGVVTKPFQFEGNRRMRLADDGIDELHRYVDTQIVIPNQNLFRVANEKTTFADAFAMADEVLFSGVACITDLMTKDGLINLDFADVRAVMRGMGKAMMGTGEASGEDRARHAAEAAIANPLLDDVSMQGARGLLISITGGKDMTLYEVDEAASRIREEVDSDANIILGATFDDSLNGEIRVSVVATGTEAAMVQAMDPHQPNPERVLSVKDNAREAVTKITTQTNDIDIIAKGAVSSALDAMEEQLPVSDKNSDVMVEKYYPQTQALEPMDDAPINQEMPMPSSHTMSNPARPTTARRMPRPDELPMVAQKTLQEKPQVNSPRAFFKRIASNVGLNIGSSEESKNSPNMDDFDAQSAIESGNPRSSRPQTQGSSGDLDVHGRANMQQLKKEHLEIPSFLRKRG
ncbi:MAG: cell division protein FtsZ [Devosiaceae bacterium]|nr:cell division protein FtsZ [Devosiaceae bacterium]